ncbi:MAG: exodeoxyribonuclease VII large subunit [Candidatus Pacebacteria bacterium]|nr:exodeoxyribonuclease VII large subunit [Candidatus Paceibacterota bacterium]
MNIEILRKLKLWRNQTARKEGVESFRVLSNKTIEDVAKAEPRTKIEMTSIKGIKDKKYYKYGKEIIDIIESVSDVKNINNSSEENISQKPLTWQEKGLNIMSNDRQDEPNFLKPKKERVDFRQEEKHQQENKIYSISEFLDFLNERIMISEVKIKGEVTSVDQREKVIYFSLKDKDDESIINCLIFRYQYEISAVKFEIGDEIIVIGYPEIYKPMGKLSLKANLIEVSGEGALKKAYDKLKMKLEKEGLFAIERKKILPELPISIGLITSSQGAAIGDFRSNLGSYGFKIKFIDSSVEGKQAVFDLISAVKRFGRMKNIDALVISRGGGSLESLQAFNNEALIREIVKLKIPIVCGVGHEKDVSLVAMISDIAVSTPTAAARVIRESWDKASDKLNHNQAIIVNLFEKQLQSQKYNIQEFSYLLKNKLEKIFYRFYEIKNKIFLNFERIEFLMKNKNEDITFFKKKIINEYEKNILLIREKIKHFENSLKIHNPERQLRLGYSITSLDGKIVRSVQQIKKGDLVDIKLANGEMISEIKKIKK